MAKEIKQFRGATVVDTITGLTFEIDHAFEKSGDRYFQIGDKKDAFDLRDNENFLILDREDVSANGKIESWLKRGDNMKYIEALASKIYSPDGSETVSLGRVYGETYHNAEGGVDQNARMGERYASFLDEVKQLDTRLTAKYGKNIASSKAVEARVDGLNRLFSKYEIGRDVLIYKNYKETGVYATAVENVNNDAKIKSTMSAVARQELKIDTIKDEMERYEKHHIPTKTALGVTAILGGIAGVVVAGAGIGFVFVALGALLSAKHYGSKMEKEYYKELKAELKDAENMKKAIEKQEIQKLDAIKGIETQLNKIDKDLNRQEKRLEDAKKEIEKIKAMPEGEKDKYVKELKSLEKKENKISKDIEKLKEDKTELQEKLAKLKPEKKIEGDKEKLENKKTSETEKKAPEAKKDSAETKKEASEVKEESTEKKSPEELKAEKEKIQERLKGEKENSENQDLPKEERDKEKEKYEADKARLEEIDNKLKETDEADNTAEKTSQESKSEVSNENNTKSDAEDNVKNDTKDNAKDNVESTTKDSTKNSAENNTKSILEEKPEETGTVDSATTIEDYLNNKELDNVLVSPDVFAETTPKFQNEPINTQDGNTETPSEKENDTLDISEIQAQARVEKLTRRQEIFGVKLESQAAEKCGQDVRVSEHGNGKIILEVMPKDITSQEEGPLRTIEIGSSNGNRSANTISSNNIEVRFSKDIVNNRINFGETASIANMIGDSITSKGDNKITKVTLFDAEGKREEYSGNTLEKLPPEARNEIKDMIGENAYDKTAIDIEKAPEQSEQAETLLQEAEAIQDKETLEDVSTNSENAEATNDAKEKEHPEEQPDILTTDEIEAEKLDNENPDEIIIPEPENEINQPNILESENEIAEPEKTETKDDSQDDLNDDDDYDYDSDDFE